MMCTLKIKRYASVAPWRRAMQLLSIRTFSHSADTVESRFAYSVPFRLRSASLHAAFNLHFPYRSPVPPTLLIPVHKFISSKFIHVHKYSD